MRKTQIGIFIFLVSFISFFCFHNPNHTSALDDTSQQILDLRKQIDALTLQAQQYKGTIAQKQKEADTLNKQITILNNQILKLQTQIVITQKQVSTTKLEIDDANSQIYTLNQKITQNQATISEIINSLNQRDEQNLITILIKNPRLSSFMNELNNIESLNNQLTTAVTELKAENETMKQQKGLLEGKKSDLESLNKKQTAQKNSLDFTKTNKNVLLIQTKGQEQLYQQLLSEAEQKQAAFFKQLQAIEKDAVASGAIITHVTATSIPPRGIKIFKYPLDDYYLTQGYGRTSYAKRGAYGGQPHSGIDLSEAYGAAIHPIGHGWILASSYNVGFGNWVAVRHDNNMVSVYAHMSSPEPLASNTEVNLDDTIGYQGNTGNSTGSHVHLSLYKDFFTYINPKNNQLYFNYFDGTVNPLDYL